MVVTRPFNVTSSHRARPMRTLHAFWNVHQLLLLHLFLIVSVFGKQSLWNRLLFRNNKQNGEQHQRKMGQAVRIMKYDRSANEAAAIPALQWAGTSLKWFRLDDGVMGGQSETVHEAKDGLHFTGTINTSGGGFASIRAPIDHIPKGSDAIRLVFRGDGKTYKLLLSDGNPSTGSPFAKTPSWQADIHTEDRINSQEWQEVTLPFTSLLPAFGGRAENRPPAEEHKGYKFHPSEMRQIGIMLSLRLSDGRPNPAETFGEGIFPFSLCIKSIDPVNVNE